MLLELRPACLALALAVIAGPACAQTWAYEPDTIAPVYRPRVVYQERFVPRPYYNAYAYEPVVTAPAVAVGPVRRTVVNRTIIPQRRGRGPVVKEHIVTETTVPAIGAPLVTRPAVAAYAYAPAVTEAYAFAPAPAVRVVRRPVAVTESYAYAPVPAPVVASVPVVRPYVNPLAVEPVTGVFLTDE